MFEEAPNLKETGGTVLLRRDSLRRIFDFYREEGRMGGGKVGENFFFFFCIVIICGYGDCLTPLRENVCECLLEIDAYWNRAARVC